MSCDLQWLNLCFDLPSLVAELFPGHTHKSLESLVVGGACQLRRIFTMRDRPKEGDDVVSVGRARDIPETCQLLIDHTPISTQVTSHDFITCSPHTCRVIQVVSSVTNDNQGNMYY